MTAPVRPSPPTAAWLPAPTRSPCTVNDRYRDRPLTGSGPTATRTSHTPGRRCRIDPLPRASLMSSTVRTTIDTPTGVTRGRRPDSMGRIMGCDLVPRSPETAETAAVQTDLGSAPGGIRTPNLLIRTARCVPNVWPSTAATRSPPSGRQTHRCCGFGRHAQGIAGPFTLSMWLAGVLRIVRQRWLVRCCW